MRYLSQIIIAALLVVSCQIVDENAPTPDEAFIKYYGDLAAYEASDIEILYDASGETAEGLIVFGSRLTDQGDRDLFLLRTDLGGNVTDTISYGYTNQTDRDFDGDGIPDPFRGDDRAGQILPLPEGGFVIVGTSSITINSLGISDLEAMSIGFLNSDLTLSGDTLFTLFSDFPPNTDLDLVGNDVILLSDGSLLFAGAIEVDRGGGVTDLDNYFLKFNSTDGMIFAKVQGEPGEDDIPVRVFEKAGGNLVCIGYSESPSLLGENNGNNGTNVYYLELSPDGIPVNFVAYGLEDPNPAVTAVYNERVSNAIETPWGYSVVGTSITSADQELSFVMNLSRSGIYFSGNNYINSVFYPEGTRPQTRGVGITLSANNEIIMVGQYLSFASAGGPRREEGMFVKFDQSAQPAGNESFFGLADGDDAVVDAVTLPDGKIVAVANVDFGGGVRLISLIKLNDTGALDR